MNKEKLLENIGACGFPVENIHLPDKPLGNVSQVWIIRDKDKDNQKWVVKKHPSWIRKSDINWVNRFIVYLHKAGYPVATPVLPFVETEEGILEIYNFVEGELYDANNKNHISALGQGLGKLHSLSLNLTIKRQRNWFSVAESNFSKRIEKTKRVLDKTNAGGVFESSFALAVKAWEDSKMYMRDTKQRKIFPVHGDFQGANVRFNGNNIAGVFDFDNARNDFPEADIAKTIRKIGESDPENERQNIELFLQSYSEYKGDLIISPEIILASKLLLEANEVLYLCRQLALGGSDGLQKDIEYEAAALSKTVTQRTRLMELFGILNIN